MKRPWRTKHRGRTNIVSEERTARSAGSRGQFVYDESGAPVRGYGVVFDVTERKEQEEALRRSESIALSRLAEIQTLYSASPVGLGFVDRSMRYVRVNDTLARINGISTNEHIGRTVEQVVGRAIWKFTKPIYDRVLNGETIVNMAVEGAITADPEHWRHWLVSYCPVRTANGLTLGVALAIQEVTELRKAQEELRLSEARLRAAKTAARLGVYECDLIAKTTRWDERMLELWGFDPDFEMTPDKAFECIHPDDVQSVRDAIERAFDLPVTKNFSAEYRVISAKDKKVRWISANALPLSKEGKRLVGTAQDITERKAFEAELERLVAERTASLREAMAQMEEFSYTVSHDLRAPLRALRVYADVLLENFAKDLPEEARECLNRIEVNANSLDKMVLDVLTFTKVARAEMTMERVATDRLVRKIVEQHCAMTHAKVTIHVEPLPDVLGHEPSLTQAFSNLLSNAVKFVAPGVAPFVRVWSERHGDKIRFWVCDNGVGIAPKYHHRLFSMFERIHPDLIYEGTGVGLAIVRKAAERMGGKVGVESDGTHGSRFWMDLQTPQPNENWIKQHDTVGRG